MGFATKALKAGAAAAGSRQGDIGQTALLRLTGSSYLRPSARSFARLIIQLISPRRVPHLLRLATTCSPYSQQIIRRRRVCSRAAIPMRAAGAFSSRVACVSHAWVRDAVDSANFAGISDSK